MNREYVNRNRAQIRLTATFYPLLHGLIGTMFGIVFLLGSRRMLAGHLSIGDFVALQFYLGRMIWPLIALGWVINLYQRGMASMVRLHEVWSVPPDVLTEAGTPVDEAPHGDIDVRDLTFSYDRVAAPESGRRYTLRNINLQVRAGETVGIVGRTGSGKSTLLALLTRAFEAP